MKHKGFACLAAFAVTVLAALTFISCGKQEAAQQAPSATAESTGSTVFDKTTAHLEKGGISFSFTDGAAANTHKTTRTKLYDYSTANVVYNTIHRKKQLHDD